jgi:hypothetical protein
MVVVVPNSQHMVLKTMHMVVIIYKILMVVVAMVHKIITVTIHNKVDMQPQVLALPIPHTIKTSNTMPFTMLSIATG